MHNSLKMILRFFLVFIFCAPEINSLITNDSRLLQTQILSAEQLKEIQNQLAKLLDIPNEKLKPLDRRKKMVRSESRFLIEMYNDKHDIELQPSSRTHLSNHFKKTVPKSDYIVAFGAHSGSYRTKSKLVLNFRLSKIPKGYKFIAAELRLFRKLNQYENQTFRILSYIFSQNKTLKLRQDVWNKHDHGWLTIDINNVFTNQTADFLKIIVIAKLDGKTVSVIDDAGVSGIDGSLVKRPFLVSYFNSDVNSKISLKTFNLKSTRRTGRSTNEEFNEVEPNACMLKFFYVDFHSMVKFDRIIVPQKFPANFCVGRCKYPLKYATNHANLLSLYSIVNPVLEPKCSPQKLAALDIIYSDIQGNFVHKTVDQMIVKRCSCQ